MKHLNRLEAQLLAGGLALALLAVLAPPLAQPADYHLFADQRSWHGVPFAMDVLSNLPFALLGIAGMLRLRGLQHGALDRAQCGLAALFFAGLLLTAACSAWYHWRPDNAGLTVDRLGMVVAFAGLLGLGVAGRVSARAGVLTAMAALLFGPISAGVWAETGNVLPWAVLQFGAMALLLALAWVRPLPSALAVAWAIVILIYALAKVLELGDAVVYAWSGALVSGHTLKHVVAALAAWPVLRALKALRQNVADCPA